MLASIFLNRWFIGAFVFFVLCVGGSLLYMQHVQRIEAEALAKTQEHIRQWNEKRNQHLTENGVPVAEGTSQERAHEKTRVGSEAPTGVERPPIGSSGERVVPKEHMAKMREYYASIGLEPPPPGYHGYRFDENGNVTKPYKYNVPEFEVKWSEEESPGQDYSKLTQEEWKRHRALRHIVRQTPLRLTQEHEKILRAGGPFPTVTYAPGVVELAKEKIRELDRKASGRHPVGSTTVTWSRPPTDKELEYIARREYELLQELESQKPKPPPPTGWTDETFFYALVRELEAEVQGDKQ